MSLLRLGGVVTVFGAMLFIIAAFMPISGVYAMRDAGARSAMITSSPRAWTFSLVLFGVGAWSTVLGIAFSAYALRMQPQVWWSLIATVFLAIGTVAWSWILYQRIIDPVAFANGLLPSLPFAFYTVLTIAALACAGIALLQLGLGSWSAWSLIVGSLLLLTLYLVFGDMPPFAHYFLAVVLGIALFRAC